MVRQTEQALHIAYPKLDRDSIDVLIAALQHELRDRAPGPQTVTQELTLGYLIQFRTRRWGLPPSVGGRPVTRAAGRSG